MCGTGKQVRELLVEGDFEDDATGLDSEELEIQPGEEPVFIEFALEVVDDLVR